MVFIFVNDVRKVVLRPAELIADLFILNVDNLLNLLLAQILFYRIVNPWRLMIFEIV